MAPGLGVLPTSCVSFGVCLCVCGMCAYVCCVSVCYLHVCGMCECGVCVVYVLMCMNV